MVTKVVPGLLIATPDAPRAAQEACARMKRAILDGIRERGTATIALSGGSSPLESYRLLAKEAIDAVMDGGRVANVAVVEAKLGMRMQVDALREVRGERAAVDDLDRLAGDGVAEEDVAIGIAGGVHAIGDEVASAAGGVRVGEGVQVGVGVIVAVGAAGPVFAAPGVSAALVYQSPWAPRL